MRLPTRGWIGESKVERVVRLVNWAALALILDSHDLMTEVTMTMMMMMMMMMSCCTHSNNDSPSIAPPDKRTSFDRAWSFPSIPISHGNAMVYLARLTINPGNGAKAFIAIEFGNPYGLDWIGLIHR